MAKKKQRLKPFVKWRHDKASPDGPSGEDVLLAWITSPGFIQRWRRGHAQQQQLSKEIARMLAANGFVARKMIHVLTKICAIESGYINATAELVLANELGVFLQGRATDAVTIRVRRCSPFYRELTPVFGTEEAHKRILVPVSDTPGVARAREMVAAFQAAARENASTPAAASKSVAGKWKESLEKNRFEAGDKSGGPKVVRSENAEREGQGAATTSGGDGAEKESSAAAAAKDAEADKAGAVVGSGKPSVVVIEAQEKNAGGADVDMEEKSNSVAEEGKDGGDKQKKDDAPVQDNDRAVEKENKGGASEEKQGGDSEDDKGVQGKKAQGDDRESDNESTEEEVGAVAKAARVVSKKKLYESSDSSSSDEDDSDKEKKSESDDDDGDREEQIPLAQRDEMEVEDEEDEQAGQQIHEKEEADTNGKQHDKPNEIDGDNDRSDEDEEAEEIPEQGNAETKASTADAESSSSDSSSEDGEHETEDARPAAKAVSDDEDEPGSESELNEEGDDGVDAIMDESVKDQSDPEDEAPAQLRTAQKRNGSSHASPTAAKRTRRSSAVTIELERETFIERAKQELAQRQELFELERAKVECELQAKQVQLAMEKSLARKTLLGAGIDPAEVDRVLPL